VTWGSRAEGPRSIRDEIMRLRDAGLFSIPVRVSWSKEKGHKKGDFPSTYAHIRDAKSWEDSIEGALQEVPNANGVAILTGPSRIYCIDVDVKVKEDKKDVEDDKEKKMLKLPGIQLWNQLVAKHGHPQTLQARSGSGGLHLFFKASTPGLTRTRNFQGIEFDRKVYGVDGRGVGGVVFAQPASYVNGEGKLATYEWLIDGPPSFDACQDMPPWLTALVNDIGKHATMEEEDVSSIAKSVAEHVNAIVAEGIEAPSIEPNVPAVSSGSPHSKELLLAKFAEMLKKTGYTTSTYAGSLSHGLYGTYYCNRTHGPRRCFFTHTHLGSNNFNLLKRGRNVMSTIAAMAKIAPTSRQRSWESWTT
jgi:hypothetical protein